MLQRRRGMTLLEVVIALTISGVALAAGAAALGFLTDQHSRSATDSAAASLSARTALREWLSAADLGTSGDVRFAGTRTPRGEGTREMSSVDFVTRAPTPIAAGGDARTRVRLLVVRQSGRDQLMAELSGWPHGDLVVLPLADSVVAFDVRYRSSVFGPPQWLQSWVSTSVLPAMAELRIATPTRAGLLLTLPIAVQVGERR